ncbi:FHA domain-containing protein [Pseudobacteriovorax antillogorgiicola]|uniref:Forkhead associated (FHA) domain, binds pSer, pThr, pTyr n=1 Tax=Pseudobacteriovorax antillogorgiicola TaxID=1513793 RepID=A0A1Y6C909_9BACT|nr:FHA domain-containing protein [Pseudobacteriovorax antillogorgiicola]TCS51796.1 pSer/pThr/pTyr-binding forkhead associated (FHA) protein [Pseudobacteriovorax antillogorgiicola]SMF50051.1 Forkhead associated (FHA) domain, binds pSer, pThr, pTyr [Pseudobacteriovorax antillogorgiicola]
MTQTGSNKDKRGVLVCISGKRKDEIVKLRRDNTIFGREKADVIVSDAEVSATHFQVQNIDDVYHIFDMNSSNGTYVNGERIVKAKLREGDVIEIGKTSFRFALEDEKNVRHIPTLFSASRKGKDRTNSLVDTLIEDELKSAKHIQMVIQVTYGDQSSETIELQQKVAFIGRASSFGHFDQDTEISRKHLMIKLNDTGEIFVEDQGSTNGSFINGKRITGMHLVKKSDKITVGQCHLYIYPKGI